MSALDRPSEVLLIALFDAAGKAEAAVRALLSSGRHAADVALLARGSRGAALGAVSPSARFELPGIGRVVACGALAVELGRGPASASGDGRLAVALRRAGLSATDVSPLEHAVRADRILMLTAVPRGAAQECGHVLQRAGALSLSARPRLDPWPPRPLHRAPASHCLRRARLTGSSSTSAAPFDGPFPGRWMGKPRRRVRSGGREAPCRSSSPCPARRSARA